MEQGKRVQYQCVKCGGKHYVHDQIQTTGGNFAKLFDIQNKKFITISCSNCGFTELFRKENSKGMDVLDFLMGS